MEQLIQSETEAEERLGKYGYFAKLESDPESARISSRDEIKAPLTMPHLGPGDPAKKYQIILQPGHYGRTSGKTGAQSRQPGGLSEQDLVAFIVANVAKYLADQKVNVLVVAADGYERPLKTDIFLAVHADGSESDKCPIKPSLATTPDPASSGCTRSASP